MGLKPPAPQNREKRKQFFLANPTYPGAKEALRQIVESEYETAFNIKNEKARNNFLLSKGINIKVKTLGSEDAKANV